ADERQRVHELSVNVALHDLGGDGRRAQTEFLTHNGLHGGRQMRARPDSAAELSGGGDVAGASEPLLCAAELVVHKREFEAESCGLGVDAVAASDARGEHV